MIDCGIDVTLWAPFSQVANPDETHLSQSGFRLKNRLLFVTGVSIPSPSGAGLRNLSCSASLPALAFAAISKGMLVLLLSPPWGLEVA